MSSTGRGPEPVVAVGGLQPVGTCGAFGLTKLSPGGGMLRQHQANQAAGELSARKGAGQSPDVRRADRRQLNAFDTKIKGRGIKVLRTLAGWNRSDVRVRTIPGRLATKVIIDQADGGPLHLESTNISGYSQPLLDGLTSAA